MHNNIMAVGQPATDNSPAVPERTIPETFSNISLKDKPHYDAEAEAIHLIFTGIGDDIYSTVDACKTAHHMWIAIERFVTIVKQTVDLDKESYHKLLDILKQYQKEVNEIRAKKIARNANPLALVAAAQQYPDMYYQTSKPHKSYARPSKQSSSTRSHITTRHNGKEIAKPITPPSESASEEDNWQFGNQRTVTVAGARETIGSQETKRAKDYSYHKEKMLLCKHAEKGILLQAEQSDWLEDTDEEIDEHELKEEHIRIKGRTFASIKGTKISLHHSRII
ncbi:hypothetical protein Tco_1244355 [Tanacetum coccineum]